MCVLSQFVPGRNLHQMPWKVIRLEAASSFEFPLGLADQGYLIGMLLCEEGFCTRMAHPA
jgi:hypothetical protein